MGRWFVVQQREFEDEKCKIVNACGKAAKLGSDILVTYCRNIVCPLFLKLCIFFNYKVLLQWRI